MSKKKSLLIATLALIVAGVTLGSTLAFFTDTKEQQNTFTMGNVSIKLDEPLFGKDGTYEIKNVTPGDPVVKDPTITVGADSEDTYLRAAINYTGLTPEQITELEKGIQLNPGWKKGTDGKYYYNEIATKGKTYEIFHTVIIPEGWSNEIAKTSFTMTVVAEAVQSKNLTTTTDTVDGVTYITNWTDSKGGAIEVK